MTRDEITNMSAGREMDELTAFHVMDWGKRVTALSGIELYVNKETGKDMIGVDLWQPSRFIVYAWQIVDRMEGELRLHEVMKFTGQWMWQAEFHQPGSKTKMVRARTATLAICRAALLEVMDL